MSTRQRDPDGHDYGIALAEGPPLRVVMWTCFRGDRWEGWHAKGVFLRGIEKFGSYEAMRAACIKDTLEARQWPPRAEPAAEPDPAPEAPRKRGRPKGSPNRPKEAR